MPSILHIHPTESGVAGIHEAVHLAPDQPGVYRFFDRNNRLLYVGKAKRLRIRLRAYLHPQRLPERMQRCVRDTVRVEMIETRDEQEALLLEASLIRSGRPRDNVLLQDSGFHPRLVLDRGLYPRLRFHRGPVYNDVDVLATLGDAASAKRVQEEIQRHFGLRTCDESTFSRRSRPCLLHQIGRCSAPCVERITPEAYRTSIEEAKSFLKSDAQDIRQRLIDQMQKASEQMEYEHAMRYRDRLRALDRVAQPGGLGVGIPGDLDVLVLVRASGLACLQDFLIRGGRPSGGRARFSKIPDDVSDQTAMESLMLQAYATEMPPSRLWIFPFPQNVKKLTKALTQKSGYPVEISSLLKEERSLHQSLHENATAALERRIIEHASHEDQLIAIGNLFGLMEAPHRIEIYDNSHLSGTNMVGAMVVVGQDGIDHRASRIFKNVGDVRRGDDVMMMKAVLQKRFSSLLPLPDLILVDGGSTQRNAVLEVLTAKELNIPVVGIAKGPQRHAGRERFFTESGIFDLPIKDPRLFALQRWRDAVHEKAVGAQRRMRKQTFRTRLDDIVGLGPVRRKRLIQHFGSSKAVFDASISQLLQIKGINESLAKKIKEFQHQDS